MKNAYINERLVRRNSRIAQVIPLVGLLVLGAGMFVSIRMPEQVTLSFAALIGGFILTQVGIYYMNRWGRKPQQFELINQALKGLDNKYTLFHYYGPTAHILVSPNGVWALLPYYQRGKIEYDSGKWKQKGGNLYMKLFAQESLGRPDLEVQGAISGLRDFLQKEFPDQQIPVRGALVFTNPKVTIETPDKGDEPTAELQFGENGLKAPVYTVEIGKLKDLVRRKVKDKSLSLDREEQIVRAMRRQFLGEEI